MLVKKARKPATKIGQGFDLSNLQDDELLDLARLCIMALTGDQADILAVDPEIKAKFKYDGD